LGIYLQSVEESLYDKQEEDEGHVVTLLYTCDVVNFREFLRYFFWLCRCCIVSWHSG